jgi:cytochrome P450
MQKLRAEIASTCGVDPVLSRTKLKAMHYLQNVLRESKCNHTAARYVCLHTFTALRLCPAVPINLRTALRDTVLPVGGGPDGKSPVFVPQGTTVTFCPYALHRRPDLYGTDAALFRPERWDESIPLLFETITAKRAYIPFGAGPRTCLGSE